MYARLLVDTSRYAELLTPDVESTDRLRRADEVWLSLITIGELRSGFASGTKQRANEERLDQFIHIQGVGVLLPDDETARHYADINSYLRSIGKMIPTNDIWIAAQALQHDLTLDANDDHFKRVPNLKLVR